MGRAPAFACVPAVLVLGGLGLLAAGCGGSGAAPKDAATSTGTTTTSSAPLARAAAFRSFRSCLRAHGVDLRLPRPRASNGKPVPPARGRGRRGIFLLQRLTAAQRKAFQTCRSKLPNGGRFRGFGGRRPAGRTNPAFAKYTRCLAGHGVEFGTRQQPAAFRKAQAACRSLLPTAG